MALDDPELLAEFVTEAREHLAGVEGQLLDIESGGADVNVDLVNTVFRAIHSVKGAAGFLGLSTVNKLAHSLENILGKMRNLELAPTSPIVDTMLQAADVLTKLINNLETSNDVDVSNHIAALDAINAGNTPVATSEASASTEESTVAAAPEMETELVSPALEPAAELRPAPAASPESIAPQVASIATPAIVAAVERSAEDTTSSSPTAKAGGTAAAGQAAVPQGENSIRVSVGVLDSLMNLAGELVLGRNQLVQTISTQSHDGIDAVAARLDQVTSELQEAIMQTRMQPIGNVFNKFPRVMRDLSAKLGKQCELLLDGKDVEVDKTIVEAIGDPLTHLVRNSVDHGVERPDVRTAKGKNPCGTVKLRAYHQAGKVRIDVADDGAGIDPSRLKEKAVAKGVITAEQASRMGDRDAMRLIFHPGFSTAEKITDVSGRGVGMDVVRTNIEKLGGTVDVDSTPGQGSTIQIELPLTLAIIPSLIIRSRGERFAVPQVNVLELVRVKAGERERHLGRVKDAEVLRLRGALLPLIRLADLLQLDANSQSDASRGPVNIIVIESGQHRYGLVVDEIVDSEEIVVKPLGRHIKSSDCLAGATILGDGHVALILDAAGIATSAELATTQDEKAVATARANAEHASKKDEQDLLLFNLADTDRFAIPMSLVARIERVAVDKIDVIGKQRLLQYHGYALPLIRLEDHVTTQQFPESTHLFVIVFRAAGREIGLLAPQLEDICRHTLEVDTQTFREQGIAGAFVMDSTTIRLVDIVELAQLECPDWFDAKQPVIQQEEEAPLTILVAEDSSFFRKQLTEFLISKGFQVVACEDGALAWKYLSQEPHEVRLVITDIEMPNMNGFELCSHIKQHPTLSALPVIALTSLASDADQQRGREAGVDDYQVKMDRERVEETVKRLLHGPMLRTEAAVFRAEPRIPRQYVNA